MTCQTGLKFCKLSFVKLFFAYVGATSNSGPEIPNGNSPPKNSNSDPKPDHQLFPQNDFRPVNENKPPPDQESATHSKNSVNFQTPPAPEVQATGTHPSVESHNGITFTPTNSSNDPYANLNDLYPNIIDQVNFRFLLVENLPSALKVQQLAKNKKQTKLDFELIKAWVDFRHFLMVQTDPKNLGTSTVGLWEVYDFTNSFIEKLLLIQKNLKIDSATPSPTELLQKVFGFDSLINVPTSETSNKATDGFESREPGANKGY